MVLLVLGSLSNVVGYQSVKSRSTSDSPLFIMRTQRANNQQEHIITSQYLGMEKGIFLHFQMRGYSNQLQKKFIEIINKMDDKTFERFTELCIQKIRREDSFRDTNFNVISQALRQLRVKPETNMNTFMSENNSKIASQILPTSGYISACGRWVPGCILQVILSRIIAFLLDMFQWPTYALFCWPSGQIPCNIIIYKF